MMRTIATRLVCWMMLMSLAVVPAVEQPALGAEGKATLKKVLGGKGRRLPPTIAGGQRKAA